MSLAAINIDILCHIMDIRTLFELRLVSREYNAIWRYKIRMLNNDQSIGIVKYKYQTEYHTLYIHLPLEFTCGYVCISPKMYTFVKDCDDVSLITEDNVFSMNWGSIDSVSPIMKAYIQSNMSKIINPSRSLLDHINHKKQ